MSREEALNNLLNHQLYSERFLKIVTKSGQLEPLKFNVFQKEAHEAIKQARKDNKPFRGIWLKCRQVGLSTYGSAFNYHQSATRFHHRGTIIAHDQSSTNNLFNMCKRFRDYSPEEIRPMTRYSNEKAIVFDNPDDATRGINPGLGSSINVENANNLTAGRSATTQTLHISELAFWSKAPIVLTGLLQSVPYEPGTSIIIESTANGVSGDGEEFYKRCMAAMKGESAFQFFFCKWTKENAYEMEPPPGFTLTPYERELLKLHPDLNLRKLAWRRYKIENEMGSTLIEPEDQFKQEYPLCLTGEVRVSTEKGILPIKDSLNAKTTESGAIIRSGPQPESDIYKLTTKLGRVIRGTGDHPVHTPSGDFYGIADLVRGQQITLRPPMFATDIYCHKFGQFPGYKTHIEINEEWARFLGYFMGDGSWYNGCVSFVCDAKDQDVVEDVSSLTEKLFYTPNRREIQRVKGRKGAIELRIGLKEAQNVFLSLGLIAQSDGKSAYRRRVHVPDCIWRSPKHIVKEFLKGLFESDGSSSGNNVRWASSKVEFAREVQLLLLGFGINAPISEMLKKSGNGNPYACYTIALGVLGSQKFHDEIGFISERKAALRPETKERSRGGVPPKDFGMIDYVEKVELDGHEITYDFTIEGEHVFMANGILTHNTPEEAFISSGRPVFNIEKLNADIERLRGQTFRRGDLSGNRLVDNPRGSFRIYRDCKTDSRYAIGADVAEGLETGDFSTMTVLDQNMEQVASYHGHVHPDLFGAEMIKMGVMYNEALLAPEVNNHGLTTLTHITNRQYKNIYMRQVLDERTNDYTSKAGWQTNFKTKILMLDEFVAAYREGSIKINDIDLLQEMATLTLNPDGSVDLNGKDRVVSFCIALQAVKQLPKGNLGTYESRDNVTKFKSLEEMLKFSQNNEESYFD